MFLPHIWAWRKNRIKTIRKYIDKMIVILPFEKDFYQKNKYQVDYVGHPLLDIINQTNFISLSSFRKKNNLNSKPIISILPGSRKQEIKKKLPLMLSVIPHFKTFQFVIGGLSAVGESFYQKWIQNNPAKAKIVFDQTYTLLSHTQAALVTSGTATMETALSKVPQVVCYKTDFLSYYIIKQLVNVKYIAMINLIMEKKIIQELIQTRLTTLNLKKELERILYDKNYRKRILTDYENLHKRLGNGGASLRAAKIIYSLNKSN